MTNDKDLPRILDGGLSNVLEAYGCDLNHDLWSARLLQSDPDKILRTHLDYLEAGARWITTSSYQASIEGFMNSGLGEDEARSLLLNSVNLAEKARAIFNSRLETPEKIYIAVSMGPYGAVLADGSEYTGNYGVPDKVLRDFHRQRIDVFENSNADYYAFETIPSLTEINVLSSMIDTLSKPCWISFSCRDALHLNDGSLIDRAAGVLRDHKGVFAVGVNCTAPRYISDIISVLSKSVPDKKIIVYPNSGEVYDPERKTWSGISDPEEFGRMALEWRQKGADIIGGCCRIGPEHIQRIRDMI